MTNNVKFYVTMTDTFLSGWGKAAGKICKYVYECESYREASIVSDNARARKDQKYVNICSKKPSYNSQRYLVQIKNKENCPNWYEEGYF